MHAKKNACKSREISAFYSQVEFPFLSTLSGLKTLKIKNDGNKFLESNPEHITLWTTTYANAGKSNNIADRNSTLYVCMLVECFAGCRHALMVQFVRSELVADTCSSEQSRAQQPQPFRSTALDFDCDSQFKSDTDCTRTNDAALFAYAVVNGTWDAGRSCPERVNPGRGCLFSGP